MASSRPRVSLRVVPAPYRAAVTIQNDRHGEDSLEQFLAMRQFLNTTNETPHGRGLGLEIGDSFWFYDTHQHIAYFDGYSNRPADCAPLLREFVASGYIDTIHTYGDFTNHPFDRSYAEWAVEEMDKQGLSVYVWVNHGNEKNTQNLNRGVAHHQGARKGTQSYHLDLTRRLGVRYLWRSHLTSLIGQDRPVTTAEFCDPGHLQHPGGSLFRTKRLIKRVLMQLDDAVGGPLHLDDVYTRNRLLETSTLDDNSRLLEFSRFNNHPEHIWSGATADDLTRQLAPDVLDYLERLGGIMIVYNHLEYGNLYNAEVVACLRSLAERLEAGRIWVATSYRILRYSFVRRWLRWEESISPDRRLVVNLKPVIRHPVMGDYPVTLGELTGMTFRVPANLDAEIRLDGDRIAVVDMGRESGRKLVMIPLEPLTFPN